MLFRSRRETLAFADEQWVVCYVHGHDERVHCVEYDDDLGRGISRQLPNREVVALDAVGGREEHRMAWRTTDEGGEIVVTDDDGDPRPCPGYAELRIVGARSPLCLTPRIDGYARAEQDVQAAEPAVVLRAVLARGGERGRDGLPLA